MAYSKPPHSSANSKIIHCFIRFVASVIQEFHNITQPGIILTFYNTVYISRKESMENQALQSLRSGNRLHSTFCKGTQGPQECLPNPQLHMEISRTVSRYIDCRVFTTIRPPETQAPHLYTKKYNAPSI